MSARYDHSNNKAMRVLACFFNAAAWRRSIGGVLENGEIFITTRDVKDDLVKNGDGNLSPRVAVVFDTLHALGLINFHMQKAQWADRLEWSGSYTVSTKQLSKIRRMLRK